MADFVHLTPLDGGYPSRLRSLDDPPASITIRGGPIDASPSVAIVGSRAASNEALAFAMQLARALTAVGVVVVSGGAEGIDRAAHEGALSGRGRTWAIAGTGHEHCFPPAHAGLFAAIAQGPGAMVWPFAPGFQHRTGFLYRNRVLVGLSDAVAVVQAGQPSGALHAASWARKLGKPLWVVPAPPWALGFDGSRRLLEAGARPLVSCEGLLRSLRVSPLPPAGRSSGPSEASNPGPRGSLSDAAAAVVAALSSSASHIDAVAVRSKLTAQLTAATLLTLALEDVVVEGPPSFFRRRDDR